VALCGHLNDEPHPRSQPEPANVVSPGHQTGFLGAGDRLWRAHA
jgi:hypothetical protein